MTEAMLTMRPPPAASMRAPASRQPKKAAVRLMSMMRPPVLGGKGLGWCSRLVIPALLTRTSIRPKAAATSATVAHDAASSATSSRQAIARCRRPSDLGSDALGGGAVDIGHRDMRAGLGQRQRRDPADAGAGAGDEGACRHRGGTCP